MLAELVDAHKEAGRRAGLDGPIVTHCSDGVGRAGTFIAIHINLEKMKRKQCLGSDQQDVVDIPRTVALLRQSRAGMVQTAEQYQFIYDVVRDAARERSAIGGPTALPKQHNDEL